MEFAKLQGLATMIDAIIGSAPREVALVCYGTEPTLLGKFSSDLDELRTALNNLQPCTDDPNAATFDAVAYYTSLLDGQNTTIATPSCSSPRPVTTAPIPPRKGHLLPWPHQHRRRLRRLLPRKTEILNDLKYGGGSGPIGLLLMAVNAVKHNAPKALAEQSGGEYINFTTQKGFDKSLGTLSNHIHNYYLISFQPQPAPAPVGSTFATAQTATAQTPGTITTGLHRISVRIPDHPGAHIRARESYWSGSPSDDPK